MSDTEITFTGTYTCTHHNDAERTACPVCLVTALTAERDQLRDQLSAARHRETIALASWDEERNRALREGARVVEWRDRAELAEAELATERARRDDLVADINDACITLASAKDDCDDYALLNTGFKLTAVRDVLLQYIPNAAMKGGEK
jgi:hypothetical protein